MCLHRTGGHGPYNYNPSASANTSASTDASVRDSTDTSANTDTNSQHRTSAIDITANVVSAAADSEDRVRASDYVATTFYINRERELQCCASTS